jgi:hypothetical protein
MRWKVICNGWCEAEVEVEVEVRGIVRVKGKGREGGLKDGEEKKKRKDEWRAKRLFSALCWPLQLKR